MTGARQLWPLLQIPAAVTKSDRRLSLDDQSDLCKIESPCKHKKSTAIVVVLPVVLSIVVILALVFFVWRTKGRKKRCLDSRNAVVMLQSKGHPGQLMHNAKATLQAENRRFTYAELVKVTKNFLQEIGIGGFGTVYQGCLVNGTEVAVKLCSELSSQGSVGACD